jgi:hypothetical protein
MTFMHIWTSCAGRGVFIANNQPPEYAFWLPLINRYPL